MLPISSVINYEAWERTGVGDKIALHITVEFVVEVENSIVGISCEVLDYEIVAEITEGVYLQESLMPLCAWI